MMKRASIAAVLFLAGVVRCAAAAPSAAAPAATRGSAEAAWKVFESPQPVTADSPLDKLVLARLSALDMHPVLCSDATFVRRVYLDAIGTLPTADEARAFIRDPDVKNKRRLLIEQLLARDEFADYWSMKWGDILRIKAEFPVNLWPNAAQAYHRWVRASIAQNKPYDKFVRELLTSSGSNFRVGPVNFYRAIQNRTPEGIAGAVALTFMGCRAENWPKERLAGMAAFFAQIGYKPTREWKEEDVFWDPLNSAAITTEEAAKLTDLGLPQPPAKPATKPGAKAPGGKKPTAPPPAVAAPAPKPPVIQVPRTAVFPDGISVQLSPDRDPREVFANWLITPKNPWLTRCIVNRVWAWLVGRGIIHEPDDIRPDNPPSNPALLAYLEQELVAGNYNLKRLYRLILNSQTYQFSSVPRFASRQAEANFASYTLRRLDAEVLIDAINQITGTSDLYTSAIPEPFTYIPQDQPAIAIADGSITSPFLALFGRSARATGMENERNNKPMPAQWLHMLNSSHIQRKLEQGPKLTALLASGRKPGALLEELYLTILSRFPTPAEVANAESYGSVGTLGQIANKTPAFKPGKGKGQGLAGKAAAAANSPKALAYKRREDWIDITWALINSTEFQFRH